MEPGLRFQTRTAPAWGSASCVIAPGLSGRLWICAARPIMAPRFHVFSIQPLAIPRQQQKMAEPVPKQTEKRRVGEGTSSPAAPVSAKSRIYIVDEHTMFREGLRQLIDCESNLTVCGDA